MPGNLVEHLMNAASGPRNTVTEDQFNRDTAMAMQYFNPNTSRHRLRMAHDRDNRLTEDMAFRKVPSSLDNMAEEINHSRELSSVAPNLARASGAGYMGGKSTYIQNNGAGYQRREREMLRAPNMEFSQPISGHNIGTRVSDYRKPTFPSSSDLLERMG